MRGFDNKFRRAQRGDDNRHFVLHAKLHIALQAVIGGVANLVHRIGGDIFIGIGGFIFGQFGIDAGQPFVEHFDRARIQRRK